MRLRLLIVSLLVAGCTPRAGAQTTIHLIDLASDRSLVVANARVRLRRPVISPDGSQVAYQKADSLNHYIELVTSTGTGHRSYRVEYEPADQEMRWSPDGRSLAFRSDLHGPHSGRLQLLDTQTGVIRTLVEAFVEQFVWRSDGGALRFVVHTSTGHLVNELVLDQTNSSTLRVLEEAVREISGIQFHSYSTGLVGSSVDGLFLVPLPAGSPLLLTRTAKRSRASTLRDGRVTIPMADAAMLMELASSDGPLIKVKLPFAIAHYFMAALPNRDLMLVGMESDGSTALYTVPSNEKPRLLFRAPVGARIDWFDLSLDGRSAAVAVTQGGR